MTKKKLIITITSLCLVVVAAVAAVVGILAATTVNVNSSLTVTYTPAEEVIATTTAKFFRKGDQNVSNLGETTYSNGYLTGAETHTINKDALTVDDTHEYILFAFAFQNDAVEKNVSSKVLHIAESGLTTSAENMNVQVKKAIYKTNPTPESSDPKPVDLKDANAVRDIKALSDSSVSLGNIQIGETGYVYIVVELGEKGKTASWQASSINFRLTASGSNQ